jgi:hypothetical protein
LSHSTEEFSEELLLDELREEDVLFVVLVVFEELVDDFELLEVLPEDDEISPPGIMIVEPDWRALPEERPLNCAISSAFPPYFWAIEESVSPERTVCCIPETGKITSTVPCFIVPGSLMSFAQRIVFTETPKF